MQLTNVSTAQLEYLVAAVDSPSWKDAAAIVGVTPSALGQGVAELERRLGLQLFDKQGRSRVPTSLGQEAATHARRILAELRELHRWAADARTGATGQVTIGMIDTAAIHHFGDELMRFRAARPDVTLRLVVQPSNALLDALRNGDVDAVVAVDPDDDERFELTPLIDEPLYAYAPPGVPAGPPRGWGPWVGFPSVSRSRALIARALRRKGATYDVVAESSQPAVLREMVRLGMGWCVLPESDAESGAHALARAHADPVAQRTLTLARRSDRSPTAALEALLEAISR